MDDFNTVSTTENIETESNIETQDTGAPDVEAQPEQEGQETVTQTEVQKAIDDWSKDNRFERSWKKDPNMLYKSYRDLEKVYPKVKSEAERYGKLFKELGVAPDKLPEVYKEYQTLKDPNNRNNQLASYMEEWLNDGVYKQNVIDYFESLEKKKIQDKYGANVPDSLIKEMEELKAFKNQQEKERSEREFNTLLDSNKSVISNQTKMNEDYSKKYGIDYSDETHNQLIEYCKKNQIDPKYMHRVFKDFAEEQVFKSLESRTVSRTAEKLQKTRQSGIIMPKQTASPVAKKSVSFEDRMRPLLKKAGLIQ